jgi:hypothetical protein
MRFNISPKSRLEAEVYKFNGFTVNLFIYKGFVPLKPLVLGAWVRVFYGCVNDWVSER